MPLINTSVPNLIQGVSQQPDAVRYDGQCEEQENALSSVVDGLKKRPNTRHIARLLGSAIASNSFVHFIDRDDNEKYVIIHDGTKLRAWNILTGAPASINGSTSGFTCSGSYLDSSSPLSDLKALTVADNTFLLNTDTVVQEDTSNLSAPFSAHALATVKQGDYGKLYKIVAERTLPPAEIAVTVTPSGTQFTHTFSITSGGVGYHINQDGSNNETPANVKIYPKGYSADHPDAIEGIVAPYNDNLAAQQQAANVGQVISLNVTSKTLNEEITEWVAERPVYVENLGALGTKSGTDPSMAANADSAVIAGRIADKVSYGYAGISGAEVLAFEDNFKWTQYGSSILIEIDPRDFTTGESVDYFNTVRPSGNSTIKVNSDIYDNAEVIFRTEDGLSGQGISIAYKTVDAISDLPMENLHGFKVKVTGDDDLEQDDYYVRFESEGGVGFGRGSYVETSGSEITQQVDSTTFLYRLISTGINAFSLKTVDTDIRDAGDDDTNPFPSFVGKKISNIFFYKNRLGLLSDDNVIFSEAGKFFNFFRTSVRSLLDSDPIDVAVSSSNVKTLSSAVGFQENLVIFSTNGQFVLKGGDLLTSKTVSITPITNFEAETGAEPLPVGSYIYFPFNRGNFTGLREFTVNATSDTYDSVDVTEHVPSYVPSNIIDMAGTTTEDTIAVLSGDETNALYIYKYFWSGNRKVLSSWSKFTFEGNIRGIEFLDSTLYLVTVDSEANTHLLALPLESGLTDIDHNGNTAGFLTLLDKRVRAKINRGTSLVSFRQPNGTYSSANADQPYTYYNLPEGQSIPTGGASLPEVFVDSNGDTHALKALNTNGVQVHLADGAATSTSYGYVGIPYTMKYKFSTQVFKAQSGNSASPTSASAMQVRNGSLFFDKTHTFDVKVTPDGRSTFTETFSADDRPDSETLGNRKFAEGFFRFPVHSKAKNVDIVIENDSPFDSKFNSAEFESFVHPRSKRYG